MGEYLLDTHTAIWFFNGDVNPAIINLNIFKINFKIFLWRQGLRPRNAPTLKPTYAKTRILKPYGQV
jgi:hypothetical protein